MAVKVNDRVRVEPGADGEIVVMAAWCGKCKSEVMPVGSGDCPWCGSRILDEEQLSARSMLEQLRDRDRPELEERGPAEPAPSPEGEPESAGGGARYRTPVKWTLERCLAAVREVGAAVGHTPTAADMSRAGFGSITVNTTLRRLGVTWAELVREAGFEPRLRGFNRKGSGRDGTDGKQQSRPEDSEREPQAEPRAPRSHASPRPAASGATSRSDVLLRAVALAARTFADTILEDEA